MKELGISREQMKQSVKKERTRGVDGKCGASEGEEELREMCADGRGRLGVVGCGR